MKIGIIGSGNMGRSLGLLWAEQGHQVFFGARTAEKGQSVAALAKHGTQGGTNDEAAAFGDVLLYSARGVDPAEVLKSIAIQGSVADKADVTRLFDETEQQLGSIDIVVNVAGVSVFKPHVDLTDDDFDKIFSVNTKGAMYMLQAAATRVKDGGRIVQFSTGGTKMPLPGAGLYAASKAAGEQFALALAKEIGHRQVTVNLVSPGVTDTDRLILNQEAIDHLIS